MNKYTLGTIVGTALLGLSKRKGSSIRLGKKKVTKYLIRQEYGESCSFDLDFMPEEGRIIGFDWDDSELLAEGDDGYDKEHDWERVTNNIENKIDEISNQIDWRDVFRQFNPNKHEDYTIYYDSYVDNIHEYLENNEHLYKLDNLKSVISGFPSAGNLGFIYTHTVEPGEKEIAPPKTFEEVWNLANSIYREIEQKFYNKGILLHSRIYDYEERWTEDLHDAEQDGFDFTETLFVNTGNEWKPYGKPQSPPIRLRKK